ncbi:MAG: hypothetical protein ACOH2H_09560 [Cypionkella sp.]
MPIDIIRLFEIALKLDRPAAKFVFFGFLLIAASAYLASVVQDSGVSFWTIAIAMLIFCVVIASLAQMGSGLKILLSWALVLVFFGWLSVLMAQIVTQSGFTPPFATAACLIKPFDAQCVAIQASADLPANAPKPTVAPVLPTGTIASEVSVVPGDNLVYIQFAVLTRDAVIDLATQLVAAGWNIAGADRGGERLSAADGLMEVRYFHAEDKPGAEALAKAVTAARKATPPVKLRDLSRTSLAGKTAPGQFEIWISR